MKNKNAPEINEKEGGFVYSVMIRTYLHEAERQGVCRTVNGLLGYWQRVITMKGNSYR